MHNDTSNAQIINTAVIASSFGINGQLSESDLDLITDNLLVIIHKISGVELHQIPEEAQSHIIEEVLKLVNDFVEEFKIGYQKINPKATEYEVAEAAGKSLGLLIDSI
jgi:ribosomal 30S subunit maturation factor RimM